MNVAREYQVSSWTLRSHTGLNTVCTMGKLIRKVHDAMDDATPRVVAINIHVESDSIHLIINGMAFAAINGMAWPLQQNTVAAKATRVFSMPFRCLSVCWTSRMLPSVVDLRTLLRLRQFAYRSSWRCRDHLELTMLLCMRISLEKFKGLREKGFSICLTIQWLSTTVYSQVLIYTAERTWAM